MTLLSRKADYALLILSYLHERTGTARAIAEKFAISRSFVANILKELNHRGFVESHRGVKGGYRLARPADTITLAELLESIEDGFRLTVCITPLSGRNSTGHSTCEHAGTCTLKAPIALVHQRLLEVLHGITLADLFEPARLTAARPANPTHPVLNLTVLSEA